MLTPEEQDQLNRELDGLLKSEIEARLTIFHGEKRDFARAYLERKALERAKAAQADMVEVARRANMLSTIALVISAVAVLIALFKD